MVKLRWLLAAALVPALAACTVSQTRSGQIQVGVIDFGSTVAQFQTANGSARIRKHVDGTWGLRFSDKLNQYKMGRFDDVRLIESHQAPGKTAALLEFRQHNGCTFYELLTITNNNVDRHTLRPGCNVGVEVGLQGDRMIVREAVEGLARFWIWSPNGVVHGREKPAARTIATVPPPAQAPRPAPRQQAPQPRTAAQARPVAQARKPAPAAAPAPARNRTVVMPTGSIRTDPIQPTTVVLVRGGQ